MNISIAAPPEVFNVSADEIGYVFTFYSTPSLFQIKAPEGINESDFEYVADSAVVGLTINRNNTELADLNEPVSITLQSLRALRGEVRIYLDLYCSEFAIFLVIELVVTYLCVMGF